MCDWNRNAAKLPYLTVSDCKIEHHLKRKSAWLRCRQQPHRQPKNTKIANQLGLLMLILFWRDFPALLIFIFSKLHLTLHWDSSSYIFLESNKLCVCGACGLYCPYISCKPKIHSCPLMERIYIAEWFAIHWFALAYCSICWKHKAVRWSAINDPSIWLWFHDAVCL